MAPDELDTYVDMVGRAVARWQGRLDIRMGMESDFAPFLIPYLTELHASRPFSYILGSVHPHAGYFKERYDTGDTPAYCRTYYRMLAEAAESALFDCLSHPDLIKNVDHAEWNFDRYAPDIEASLDRIAAAGTCMELNTSGLLKKIKEYNPGRSQLEMMHPARDSRWWWAPMHTRPTAWATTSRRPWTCWRTSATERCPSSWTGNAGTWTSNRSAGHCAEPLAARSPRPETGEPPPTHRGHPPGRGAGHGHAARRRIRARPDAPARLPVRRRLLATPH